MAGIAIYTYQVIHTTAYERVQCAHKIVDMHVIGSLLVMDPILATGCCFTILTESLEDPMVQDVVCFTDVRIRAAHCAKSL